MGFQNPHIRRYVRASMAEEMLSAEVETELAVAWRDNRDEAALHRLIQAYARLAVSFAGRFRRYDVPYEDLIQQGNLGLMRAAEKFDPENGARFSTYASWWIRASMQDYVMRNWSMVRTGTNATQKKLFFHLRRVIAKHIDDESREEPLSVLVARELEVPEAQVEAMMGRMSGPDLSLDAPQSSDDEGRSWVETIEDEDAQTEADVAARLDGERRRAALYDAVQQLPERERVIVAARHLAEVPTTLSDLGADMGISKERVRQLEARALARVTETVRAGNLVGNQAGNQAGELVEAA
ncbi:RNA polymerase factor sigma-32 [Pararhodobacter oceanensis]|uniref:RNA polymerase sigma factor n=1 Tax=Pararhodobacter oceanensis TaxID=2172121 RepID=A0A2T8HW26_9RHOB|nr:RNA polymerase factor sigma-32 [Pararhodobacter oceanensis]PVH29637.1 RNA polymerase factor sigma-32 [Pararhodobacter oceanensis]